MLFAVVLAVGCKSSDADKPIEIGHIHPSGPSDSEYRALKLAVEDLNHDPNRLPLNRPLAIRSAPGGETTDGWHGQATRLLAINQVAALIGGSRSSETERIAQAVNGEKAIAISPAGWAGAASSRNLFTIGLAPTERGRVLALLAKEAKADRVLIVREKEARAANIAADRFAAECRSFARVSDNVPPEQIQVEGAVLFFACSAKKMLDLTGYGFASLLLFGDEDAEAIALLKTDQAFDGLHFALACDPEGNGVDHAFSTRFHEAYGQRPNAAALLTYDAFSIWVQAARRADSREVEVIRNELLKREEPFESVTGPLRFADDHTARRLVHVRRIENGKLVPVGVHGPEAVK
jgi:ABC-type branched-subunit amino acid transport system substrate-binding protein